MATSIDDELSQIGQLLASPQADRPIELPDRQRTLLAATTTGAILAAVGRRMPRSKPSVRAGTLRAIAVNWSHNYHIGLCDESTLQHIAKAVSSDDFHATMSEVIKNDTRLTTAEKEQVVNRLARDVAHSSSTGDVAVQSHGAYITSIAAEGFRGIGRRAELPLEEGPNLTLVYGANGSGKSSFVEALDVLLYGDTGRFRTADSEWRRAWPNAHSPVSGMVEATFTVPDQANSMPLSRAWTSSQLLGASGFTGAYDSSPDDTMRKLGWLQSRDNFRPIIGYAELGPLFDEDVNNDGETPFARHIRIRSGIATSRFGASLWAAWNKRPAKLPPLSRELSAWDAVQSALQPKGLPGKLSASEREWLFDLFGMDSVTHTLSDPDQWDWTKLMEVPGKIPQKNYGKATRPKGRRQWFDPKDIDDVRHAVRRLLVTNRGLAPEAIRDSSALLQPLPGWPMPRATIYYEMVIQAALNACLAAFAQRVNENWSTIRHASAIEFRGVSLRSHYTSRPQRASRVRGKARYAYYVGNSRSTHVSLNLGLDDSDNLERGIFSQGELQTLGLSMFLPTMTQPTSPFSFAVIDDPVQVMDQYAVAGLAQVLDKYAKELQLIVFTHDERLPLALRRADIDHTLIDIQRSEESVVKCEVLYDPVTQRLRDAREEARRPESDNWMGRRQDVADQCRRAIEAACTRAVVRRRIQEGQPAVDIFEEIDRLKEDSKSSMRGLLALAIWGEEGKIGDVSKFLTQQKAWGEGGTEINGTLNQVNKLVHAADADAAKEAYGGDDLDELIDEVEFVIKAIEDNCG